MFIIKRNQVIITALVVMIAVAGYLNYIDTRGTGKDAVVLNEDGTFQTAVVPNETLTETAVQTAAQPVDEEIGIALTTNPAATSEKTASVVAPETSDKQAKTNATEPGAAVFVNTTSDTTFFVQAKLDREQARAKSKDMLTEMVNNQNVEKEQRAKAAESMLDIQKRIEKETSAEAMIEAKGFSEAYVRIDDNTVDVVVNKEVLSEAETAQILDIVKRKTGISGDKINIHTIKK